MNKPRQEMTGECSQTTRRSTGRHDIPALLHCPDAIAVVHEIPAIGQGRSRPRAGRRHAERRRTDVRFCRDDWRFCEVGDMVCESGSICCQNLVDICGGAWGGLSKALLSWLCQESFSWGFAVLRVMCTTAIQSWSSGLLMLWDSNR